MSFVKVLDIPDDKEVYVIGDIHGNFELYSQTLKELGITDDDVVISVGDIIDRGMYNSKMLFEFLNKPNRHMVLGNHEKMMMLAQNSHEWRVNWLYNGGKQTLEEIGQPGITHFCKLLEEVPYLIEVNHRGYKLGITHAAIPDYPNVSDWETIKEWTEGRADYRHELIWDRYAINSAQHDYEIPENEKLERIISGVDYVIHGHTGVSNKFLFGNRVWIDTQYTGRKLTLAQMDQETHLMKFYSVLPDLWGTGAGFTIEEL